MRLPVFFFIACAFFLRSEICRAAERPVPGEVKTLNTSRTFPRVTSTHDWEARKAEIRQQVLVSCGLSPMPDKTPLNPRVSGRVEKEGYSVEKVSLETLPGVYLTGNLFRPSRTKGKLPAVLVAHGHWNEGRFVDIPTASMPGLCINLARQGYVAFAYDMMGYNDAQFSDSSTNEFYKAHNAFGTHRVYQLWNINLMGLQTWNSIRALDFLESLPDVDPKKLACTGASGGGTQTFMLGAIDDRLAAQAPVVMVSHSMQGGCLCENAPGLRVHFSNMEIAAAAAPRPQVVVGASGDWTKTTSTIEGPAIAGIYDLLRADKKFGFVTIDAPHNYNRASREAVYAFLGKHVGGPDASETETAFEVPPPSELRVWSPESMPKNLLSTTGAADLMKSRAAEKLETLRPTNKRTLAEWKETFMPAWRRTLQLAPDSKVRIKPGAEQRNSSYTTQLLSIENGDRAVCEATYATASRGSQKLTVILVRPNAHETSGKGDLTGIAQRLVSAGYNVMIPHLRYQPTSADTFFTNHFTTYNLTPAQQVVSDLVAVCSAVKGSGKGRDAGVVLMGEGLGGLWSLLAAPAADGVYVDASAITKLDDAMWLEPDFFIPGIRRLGDLDGILALAAPAPVHIHNASPALQKTQVASLYNSLKAGKAFSVSADKTSETEILKWLGKIR